MAVLTVSRYALIAIMMQASERSEKLESEATAMEGQYASAYAGARQTYSQGRARLDAIQAVCALHAFLFPGTPAVHACFSLVTCMLC